MSKKTLKSFPDVVDAMYGATFSIETLLRKVRPYYRTSTSGKQKRDIGLRSRTADRSVRFSVALEDNGCYCADVRYSRTYGESPSFKFRFTTTKELLQKLLKHNLI